MTSATDNNENGFIAYYRVSTDKQGKSGLGIEAQQSDVETYVKNQGGKLIEAYQDIESGAHDDRPNLARALRHCRATGATLVIAKLDRLSRNAHFLTGFIAEASGKHPVKWVCCDMPHADGFTLHVMAGLAQKEREMISDRTKKALAEAKKRGVKLGRSKGCVTPIAQYQPMAVEALKCKADEYARENAAFIRQAMEEGGSLRKALAILNEKGIKTPRGKVWQVTSLANVVNRMNALGL